MRLAQNTASVRALGFPVRPSHFPAINSYFQSSEPEAHPCLIWNYIGKENEGTDYSKILKTVYSFFKTGDLRKIMESQGKGKQTSPQLLDVTCKFQQKFTK